MNDVLPDALDDGLVVVFCGTAASRVSARAGAYYANPSNGFWRALHEIGMTPRLFAPGEFGDLLALRIGLTDLAKKAAGADAHLRRQDFDRERLRQGVLRYAPQIVAFTSKRAWRVWRGLSSRDEVAYGWQRDRLAATRFFVLPSPSGAARGYWDPQPWQALAAAYRRRLGRG